MCPTPFPSPKVWPRYRLRTIFLLTTIVAMVLAAIVWHQQLSRKRFDAGYGLGFTGAVLEPPGGGMDFVHAPSQRGFDAGVSDAHRFCAAHPELTADPTRRAADALQLVKSSPLVPSELKPVVAERLEGYLRLYRDFDEADPYDCRAAMGVGFWCDRCDADLKVEEARLSLHEQGQAVMAAGWLAQESRDGVALLCPKCREMADCFPSPNRKE